MHAEACTYDKLKPDANPRLLYIALNDAWHGIARGVVSSRRPMKHQMAGVTWLVVSLEKSCGRYVKAARWRTIAGHYFPRMLGRALASYIIS